MAKSVEDLIGEISSELGRISTEIKDYAETANKEMAANGKLASETKDSVDKLLTEQAALSARLSDLEQKAARRASGGDIDDSRKTPGQLFVENEKVKAFCAERATRGRVRVDMASIVRNVVTSAPGSGGDLIQEQRLQGIIALPERRMTVRDLLTPGRTNSNAIQFVQETGFTNNAAAVSEGKLKPESSIAFELLTRPVATIAHWMLASKQVMDDAPMLQSHIDGRLRYGLAYVEEQQLLNGDGTGANLEGIVPQATAFAAAFAPADQTMIDVLRLALLQSELAEFPATGMVLHPIDWARIELTKDGESRYIFANPTQLAGPVLWGRPVVPTQAMAEDSFLAGAFRLGAQVFDREDANVEISTEDSDNFRKNLITIRAEERLALAVYRPEAFITGDFGNVT